MTTDADRRVEPYPDPPATPERLVLETYEYRMPFNYRNIVVDRRNLRGQEGHGVEMRPVNLGAAGEHCPPDTITIEQADPMVRVAVIGSACTPPGFVQLEAEPIDGFHSPVEVPNIGAVRYRAGNLWGMHLRYDQWAATGEGEIRDTQGRRYDTIPEARIRDVWKGRGRDNRMKAHYRENPLVGMSCAIFEIPKSRKVVISGGCEICAWTDDSYPDDIEYSFRIIRVTVARDAGQTTP